MRILKMGRGDRYNRTTVSVGLFGRLEEYARVVDYEHGGWFQIKPSFRRATHDEGECLGEYLSKRTIKERGLEAKFRDLEKKRAEMLKIRDKLVLVGISVGELEDE